MNTLKYIHIDEQAASKIVAALQTLLANFQVHYTNLRGFHWNIEGRPFFTLHSKFEELYDDAAEKIDEIAERILMLGGEPENKFSEYLKNATVSEVSGVSCADKAIEITLNTYAALIMEEREIAKLAESADDSTTVDLVSGYLKEQEKMVWMLTAFSSNACKR